MTNDQLKYQKKAWGKLTATVVSCANTGYNGAWEVLVSKGKSQIMMTCFNEGLYGGLKAIRPSKTFDFWYSLKSKNHNGKWYTNAYLMHFEPKKKRSKPEKKSEGKTDNDIFSRHAWGDGEL